MGTKFFENAERTNNLVRWPLFASSPASPAASTAKATTSARRSASKASSASSEAHLCLSLGVSGAAALVKKVAGWVLGVLGNA